MDAADDNGRRTRGFSQAKTGTVLLRKLTGEHASAEGTAGVHRAVALA